MGEPAADEWHKVHLEAGYIWCRPCREYHRPPECDIDQQGRSLDWRGVPWDEQAPPVDGS